MDTNSLRTSKGLLGILLTILFVGSAVFLAILWPVLTAQAQPNYLLISEVFYDTPGTEVNEEWIEIYNPTGSSVDLSNYKLGDEEAKGGSEGMYQFPSGASINAGSFVVVALKATGFSALYGFNPDYEFFNSNVAIPDMSNYSSWATGSIGLANGGDEVLLLDGSDSAVDVVTYGSGSYSGITAHPGVSEGHSIERFPVTQDTDDCSEDFRDQPSPTPGSEPTAITLSSLTARSSPSRSAPLNWAAVIAFTLAGLVVAGIQYFLLYEDAPRWLRILAPSIFAISLILIGFMAGRG